MMATMEKKIDNRWGSAETALLPESLRATWAGEALPEWVVRELRLASGSSAAALGRSIWKVSGTICLSGRLRNFILNLVNARRPEIGPLKVFMRPWPYWLDPKGLRFSTRTRNCLIYG